MLEIKKNKSNKYVLKMDSGIVFGLKTALEAHVSLAMESEMFNRLLSHVSVKQGIYESILCEMLIKHCAKLNSYKGQTSISLHHSEALALMLFLNDYDHDERMLHIKVSLHKLLLA